MLSVCRSAVEKYALIACLAVLGCPCLLSATNYTCSGPGTRNWHTATDWAPSGIPVAGDTATITAGCTMQCEANTACTVGKSSAQGSTDLTVQVGGDLVVENGASVDMRGDVLLTGELDIFGGTFSLDPAASNSSVLYYIDGGADSGADTLKICSESNCTSNSGRLGILTCSKGASGSCQIRHSSGHGNGLNVLGSHGQLSNFGTSSVPAISLTDGALPAQGGFVLGNNFSVHNNGVIQINYTSPTLNLTFDGVSFDTLVDVSGSYNGYTFLDLISLVAPTSGDRTFRATCSNTGLQQAALYIDAQNEEVGDSAHPGLIAYNCILMKNQHGGNLQNVLSIIDRNVTSGTSVEPAYNADLTIQDFVMYNHTPNQHHIVGLNSNGGGASNHYLRMIFDGDGYSGYDTGDDYQDFGTYTASYGLHINGSGTAFTLSANPAQQATLDHETLYNTFGGALCETSCTPNMLQRWSNSLFVLPTAWLGPEYPGNDGMHIDFAYRYSYRQTANSAATDYNFFWDMPGSGDPGSNQQKMLRPQLTLNGTPSWVALTPTEASMVTNQSASMNGVFVFCSNCFVNTQPKDYIVDVTQHPNQYGVIQSISDSSHAVLYTSIPRWATGDHVDVRPGWFASNGLYGVDWGSHDQHINPLFQDTTRSVCTWWKQQSGSSANCSWSNANNYTAGVGTGGNIISDTAVNFNLLGVQDGMDAVAVFSPGWGLIGTSTVLSHTATTLTVSPILGLGPGDFFTFITAPQKMGQVAIQLYGFDINGNQVAPPAWVNENMVYNIGSYLQQGYAPTNLAFYGAGSDGKTVGAVEVLPSNAAISVTAN